MPQKIELKSECELKLFRRAQLGAVLLPWDEEEAEALDCFVDSPTPRRAAEIVEAARRGAVPVLTVGAAR